MDHRNRWFTELKNGWIFPWLCNQRIHGIIGDLLLTRVARHLGDLAHLAICGTETMAFSAPHAAPRAWSKQEQKCHVYQQISWGSTSHTREIREFHADFYLQRCGPIIYWNYLKLSYYENDVEIWRTMPKWSNHGSYQSTSYNASTTTYHPTKALTTWGVHSMP